MSAKNPIYFFCALFLFCSASKENEKVELHCLPAKIQEMYALPICINERIDSVKNKVETFHYDKSVKMYVSSFSKGTQIYGTEYRFGKNDLLDSILIFGGSAYGRQDIDKTKEEIAELQSILNLQDVSNERTGNYSAIIDSLRFELVITTKQMDNVLDYKLIVTDSE